jgi:hypothetical protein
LRDEVRSYKVILDGTEVGRIKSREIFEADISPGEHVLRLRIDWTGSPEIVFDVADGEVVEFSCGPKGSPVSVLLRMFGRSNWVSLERTS